MTVTVRVNGRNGALYHGPEADFETLMQKAAEHVFDVVRPTQYAGWLTSQRPRRDAEARSVYQRILADLAAAPFDRASAWNGLANISNTVGELRPALSLYQRARETFPNHPLGFSNAVNNEVMLSRFEAALALLPQAIAVTGKQA